MPTLPRPESQMPLPFKARVIGRFAAALIGLFGLTYRIRVEDRSGVLQARPDHPILWAFWHNRIFAMPAIYRRHLRERQGAVLTSPSRDGALIAATMRCFGVASVRGSSNKRGPAAMLEMVEWIQSGYDIVVTPDGPRGPRYRLAPGLIRLSQRTGAPILPIRIEYESAWVFHKSWDRFRLPKPFSRVRVVLEPYQSIDPAADGDTFEAERQRIERILNPDHETD
ncbi:MAG: lysophospholipid acyltransferase family protein [Verrucomicrobiales bacterium]|nr:lysophospholipid acyltransferase family protein [Verrucomicrobiales bacterium]